MQTHHSTQRRGLASTNAEKVPPKISVVQRSEHSLDTFLVLQCQQFHHNCVVIT